MINADVIEGKWMEIRGKIKQRWGKLTDNDLDRINGKREELSGLLQQKYGYAKAQVDREVDQFIASLNNNKN